MKARFGEFVLDVERQELLRPEGGVHLTPKALDLLHLLIEARPRVVSKQELIDLLWPDVVVSTANLKNLVSELRGALDDHDRNGRYIRTVYGRGYAFTDQVVEDPGGNVRSRSVSLLHAGTRYRLSEGENVIGRGVDCDCVVDDEEVSRRHARVIVTGDTVTVDDLGSKNGTFLNGERVEDPCILEDLDRLELGNVSVTVRFSVGDTTTKSAPSLQEDSRRNAT